MKNLLKNYLSTIIFILIISAFYYTNNYYHSFLIKDIYIGESSFNSLYIYVYIIIFYLVFLIPFYYFEWWKSKARITLEYLQKKWKNKNYKINFEEKNSILSTLVKAFFIPLMIIWLSQNIAMIYNKVYFWYLNFWLFKENFLVYFNTYIFLAILYFIIMIDLIFFTLWYMFESKYLKNKIKSVEPTLFWWSVAILCYPPFNDVLWKLFWWYSEELPKFWNIYVHLSLTSLLLIFFAIYSWASIALWLKASNLTNRWIVKKWPYKFVRHPAYISKNISWFIWTIPAFIIAFWKLDFIQISLIIFSIISWWIIYYLRSITEEKHLEKDPEYKKYQKEVKYKFIPWVW